MAESSAQDFETWARRNGAQLRQAAHLLASNPDDADDLVQEVMVKLFVGWGRVRKMEYPEAYARRMLINEYLSLGRRVRRLRSRQHLMATPSERQDSEEIIVTNSAPLREALLSLGIKQRAVIVLRYYYDLPDAEIADLLNSGVSTVRSQAHRALKALRKSEHIQGS